MSRVIASREELVGAHFGILEECERVDCEPDDVPLFVYAGRLCRTAALQGVDAPRAASGAALDDDAAIGACLGEAVERYSAALVRPGSVVTGPAAALSGDVLTPDRFALFSSRQYLARGTRFPFHRWRANDRLTWVEVHGVSTDRPAWAPAVFVHQPHPSGPEEPLIAPTLSTGLAAARFQAQATLSGLCEVLERDAVALAWLGRVRPARIEFSAQRGSPLAAIVRSLDERAIRWGAYDLTTEIGVPIAAALLEGHSPVGPVVSFGSACHPDQERALLKALVEAAHCRMYVKSLCREEPRWNVGRALHRVESFADHARYYTCHPTHRRPLDRWRETPFARRWSLERTPGGGDGDDVEQTLSALVARVETHGWPVFSIDLTPPDVGSLGFRVVRVLVPGLQPLHGHQAWPHLGGQRLRSLRSIFGPETRQPWTWNRAPHPCP